MLSPYRVLDLTDEKGLFCGKLLADLGADVIKIERPGGDPARRLGPFWLDQADPEKSLFWFAFNTGKRGVTLDLETSSGRDRFKSLVKTSDLVIESFRPGYMRELGLGSQALEEINPGVIIVSITPFGQTGPYRDYKAPDIVAWAMGGQMFTYGDDDRAPVRISHHSQAYLNAGIEAAVGAVLALYHREVNGEAQHVDVSVQESVAQTLQWPIATWDVMKTNYGRGPRGMWPSRGQTLHIVQLWPCKDGFVSWVYWSGARARRFNPPLIEWMKSEGKAGDFLSNFDWSTFDLRTSSQETIDRFAAPTKAFFGGHTKAELLEGAVKRHVMLYPVSTTQDIANSVQLTAREFWVRLEHPELGATIAYPGPFARASESPLRVSHRAPLIGEHNREILGQETGKRRDKAATSSQATLRRSPSAGSSGRAGAEQRPLQGIRIADFTQYVVGPLATRTLAAYGAEVIRIEGKTRPDGHRTIGPFKDDITGLNRSSQFNSWNTAKLSIAVNLANPRGAEVARRIVARSEVAVENLAGGVMNKMGLGYEQLKKVKPDIIMVSSCMQGQTGPHATHGGTGNLLSALSGFNQITGWPDRKPAEVGAYTDFTATRFVALSILAALEYRRRTGKGQYIDLSQYENCAHFIAPLILDFAVNKRIAGRMGNVSPGAAPHGAYRCRGEDRWCAIAAFTAQEWDNFCNVVGNPQWTRDSMFSTPTSRQENSEELDRLTEAWTINRTAERVMDLMQKRGVAAGVLETGEDLLEHDPQLKHRRFFQEVEHPETGGYRTHRPSCFVMSKSPCEVRRAPLLGEHNSYVLKDLLGMSDDEIAELVIDGAIE